MGGVFNTTNCHLYHYAGNNPVRYTDPDGKAYIIKISNNKYAFAPDLNVFDKSVYTLTSLINFGTQAADLGHKFSDMQRLNIEHEDVPSIVKNGVMFIFENSDSAPLSFISSLDSIYSKGTTITKSVLELLDRDRVAMEYFIDDVFHNELISTSPENVEKLYNLAMYHVIKFEACNLISITPGMCGGGLKKATINADLEGDEAIELLRSTLEVYRKMLEEAE